jgi:hypothetical protein
MPEQTRQTALPVIARENGTNWPRKLSINEIFTIPLPGASPHSVRPGVVRPRSVPPIIGAASQTDRHHCDLNLPESDIRPD